MSNELSSVIIVAVQINCDHQQINKYLIKFKNADANYLPQIKEVKNGISKEMNVLPENVKLYYQHDFKFVKYCDADETIKDGIFIWFKIDKTIHIKSAKVKTSPII